MAEVRSLQVLERAADHDADWEAADLPSRLPIELAHGVVSLASTRADLDPGQECREDLDHALAGELRQ